MRSFCLFAGCVIVVTLISSSCQQSETATGPTTYIYDTTYVHDTTYIHDTTFVRQKHPRSFTAHEFASGIDRPAGLGYDAAGNLYVVALNPGTVYRITPDGMSAVFATGPNGASGLVVSPQGEVFVSYFSDNTVKRVSGDGGG